MATCDSFRPVRQIRKKKEIAMTEANLTLQRILKVWWLIFWRGMTVGFLGGGLAGFLIGIFSVPLGLAPEIMQLTSMIVGGVIGIGAGIWAVSTAFKKAFSDFRVVLVRTESPASSNA